MRKIAVTVIFVILEIIAICYYATSTPYTQARMIAWSNSVVGWINQSSTGFSSYFGLREENASLTEHIAALENRISELENARPDTPVEVGGLLAKYKYTPARVMTASTNRSRNFIILNKGTKQGVVADMAVMTPEGYAVGVVVTCTNNFSVAKILLNVDFKLGGLLAEDGSHGSIVWQGGDNQIIDFVEVSKYANVKKGDLVQVAGFSQYFPKEAIIGTVDNVDMAENGTSYVCKVRLAADMGRLHNVVLVRNTAMDELKSLDEYLPN